MRKKKIVIFPYLCRLWIGKVKITMKAGKKRFSFRTPEYWCACWECKNKKQKLAPQMYKSMNTMLQFSGGVQYKISIKMNWLLFSSSFSKPIWNDVIAIINAD